MTGSAMSRAGATRPAKTGAISTTTTPKKEVNSPGSSRPDTISSLKRTLPKKRDDGKPVVRAKINGAVKDGENRPKVGADRTFGRSATATVRRTRVPVAGEDFQGSLPPPPSVTSVNDAHKREQERRAAHKRMQQQRKERSRSPANVSFNDPLRGLSHSPSRRAGNAFTRTVSLKTRQEREHRRSVSNLQGYLLSNQNGASHRTASPFAGKHDAALRIHSSPEAKKKHLYDHASLITPPRVNNSSSAASPPPAQSPLLQGISKAIIENFGIEPEDLKVDSSTVLGTGGFGTVYIGDYQATEVAVKVHHSDRSWQPSEIQEWKREVSIMTKLRHPNILMLLGAVFYCDKLAIVTELCEKGTLLKCLQTAKDDGVQVPWRQKIEWMQQIAKGMAFLHHKRIFHRDLKAANVFVTGDTMKIADFGLSRIRRDLAAGLRAANLKSDGKDMKTPVKAFEPTPARGTRSTSRRAPPQAPSPQPTHKENSRIQGTFAFIAPEIWEETSYTEKADVYSFGVLYTELLAVYMPFAHDPREELSWRIMVGRTRVKELQTIGGEPIPAPMKTVQRACLKFTPGDRPFFTEVVSMLKTAADHDFVNDICPWPLPSEVTGDPDPLAEDVDDDNCA
eukprot:TRINITY_DN1972_c0_g1_i1.p1 TRINITY_DN1972_c0_g1~~TRINITY_DN1972_c0_g1_i1.p1  ORF type:complete len:622 (+),score=115.45 TRINITY_DN1972_c0_g1_i1:112-1977(+)